MTLPIFEQKAQAVPPNGVLPVLLPSRDGQVSFETHLALASNCDGLTMLNIMQARTPVIEARNALAEKVLYAKQNMNLRADFALWCDVDAWWPPGTLTRMLSVMQSRPDLDILTAYSCDRKPFCSAAAFRMFGDVPHATIPHGVTTLEPTPASLRFNMGEVVEVDATSFHFVMMRTSLLERLGPAPFNLRPNARFGEDMEFCFRAKQAGAKIACDTGSVVAHVDTENGLAFVPNNRPGRVDGNRFGIVPDPRSDLDILRAWDLVNIRQNRRYGAQVDAILQATYDTYLTAKLAQL